MDLLKIANGTVYDPANDVHGEARDLWLRDGKVVPPPEDPSELPTRVIDATGESGSIEELCAAGVPAIVGDDALAVRASGCGLVSAAACAVPELLAALHRGRSGGREDVPAPANHTGGGRVGHPAS